jgi:hypothetical protein
VSFPLAGVVTSYLDLPGRLLACRTPLELWLEYASFGPRLVSAVIASFSPPSHTLRR